MTNRGVQYRIKAFVPRKEKDKARLYELFTVSKQYK